MRRIVIFIFFQFVLFSSYSQSYKRCSSNEYEEWLNHLHPEREQIYEQYEIQLNAIISDKKHKARTTDESSEPIYRIPVVVHIIHNTASGAIGGRKNTNIPDSQIISQINILNQDFRRMSGTPGFNDDPVGADTRIEFCLASRDPEGNETSGIVRVYNAKAIWAVHEVAQLSKLSYWPSNQYLNVWVTDLPSGTLGFAQFPEVSGVPGLSGPYSEATDGVVIDYEYFGNQGYLIRNYEMGRTTTHEVGHWLGLRHIWGDRFCGTDYVDDTPVDAGANETGTCQDSSDCNKDGIYTLDMSNNYMDYSFDACMNIFTEGQKMRMRTVIETSTRRRDLLNSPGCCQSQELALLPIFEDFETEDFSWTIYAPGNFSFMQTTAGVSNSFRSLQAGPGEVFSENPNNNSNYTTLTSEAISFKDIYKPVLKFDLKYAPLNDSDPATDSLVISYEINCNRWETLTLFYDQELASNSEWTTQYIPLDILGYKNVGRLRLELYSKGKGTLFIDNIEVYPTSATLSFTAYPNAAKDFVHLKFIFEGHKNIEFSLYSVVGTLIRQESFSNRTTFIHTLPVSGLPEGIYIVRVTDGNETKKAKIMVSH